MVAFGKQPIIFKYEGIRIHMPKKNSQLAKNKITYSKSSKGRILVKDNFTVTAGGGSPAANVCRKALGGTPRSFTNKNGGQEPICFFEDGSYLFTWDVLK